MMFDGVRKRLLTYLAAGTLAITGCTPPVDGGGGTDPSRPVLQDPASCVVTRSIESYADDLSVETGAIEHYWNNRDSAFVLAEWDYEYADAPPPTHCVTDEEERWLDNLVDARVDLDPGSGEDRLLLDSTLEYLLNRHHTVGKYANAALEATIDEVRDVRSSGADPSQTVPTDGILVTLDYGVMQPQGHLPGTFRAKKADGSFFAPELETNTALVMWAMTVWAGTANTSFLSTYVDGMSDACGSEEAGDELNTQSMDVLYDLASTGRSNDTPVRSGALLPVELVNVASTPFLGIPASAVYVRMNVPFDDRSVLAEDGSIEYLNMSRSPFFSQAYIHLFELSDEVASFDGTPKMLSKNALLGNTAGTILDYVQSIPAYGIPDDDIPADFPRLPGTVRGSQGLHIFDPTTGAFVAEAREGGIPDDMILRLDSHYWGDKGPHPRGVFYQGECKPIGE